MRNEKFEQKYDRDGVWKEVSACAIASSVFTQAEIDEKCQRLALELSAKVDYKITYGVDLDGRRIPAFSNKFIAKCPDGKWLKFHPQCPENGWHYDELPSMLKALEID